MSIVLAAKWRIRRDRHAAHRVPERAVGTFGHFTVAMSVVRRVIAIGIPAGLTLRGVRSMVLVAARAVARVQVFGRSFAVVTLSAHFPCSALSFTLCTNCVACRAVHW
ncbi:hypothetical protein [Burkholderia vietnamiensis]|jgi:hypothetical protein|uniref:hypothetical protein n=1 Tax=Burkholderia vietnamiensis TaxID=60552 RepID=UPI0001FDABD0|nr:hypothetical protein [Burkholderia vietnamiensis]EGD05920.1 hypothetical protein B1M_03994 [Burkholderia sp. TJI49]HDR8956165.1 hypothetical protein [Burkholderia vietnamiensis]HDR9223698.1 hypothetical protein [Burkholderia vietnamiensis]